MLVLVAESPTLPPTTTDEAMPMKILVLATALIAAVAVAAPAEAASKKKHKVVAAHAAGHHRVSGLLTWFATATAKSWVAIPDPFIRMMIRKEGRIRDQSGR